MEQEGAGRLAGRPPTIAVIGISGSGKSATVDALFHRERTLTPAARTANTPMLHHAPQGAVVRLRVVDVLGMGEDDARDAAHLAVYDRRIPSCDAVLWVLAARNRALALDRMYLRRLARFADRFVFCLNQVDLVEPRDWNVTHNVPSERQAIRIADIAEHRSGVLGDVLGRDVTVTPYSASTGFGLDHLLGAVLRVVAERRRPTFAALARVAAIRGAARGASE